MARARRRARSVSGSHSGRFWRRTARPTGECLAGQAGKPSLEHHPLACRDSWSEPNTVLASSRAVYEIGPRGSCEKAELTSVVRRSQRRDTDDARRGRRRDSLVEQKYAKSLSLCDPCVQRRRV